MSDLAVLWAAGMGARGGDAEERRCTLLMPASVHPCVYVLPLLTAPTTTTVMDRSLRVADSGHVELLDTGQGRPYYGVCPVIIPISSARPC